MPTQLFVVEDSDRVRDHIVADVLALGDCELIGTAARETEAVEAIARLCPTVVVTDIGLAEGTGVEVVRRCRRLTCRPIPRVFVLTNYGDDVYRTLCLKFGAERFFDKSTDYPLFLAAMRDVVRDAPSARS